MSSELSNKGSAVGKETFIARTKVIEPRFAIWRLEEAILGAPPITHIQDLAYLTILG